MIHVAIDGPAGAGKSTIAKAVAQDLDIPYLDTGAMYRTLALYAIRRGIDPRDGQSISKILPDARIQTQYIDGVQHMLINGEDVTSYIRTPEVSKGASDIGVHPAVREKLVDMQQAVSNAGSVVMDGRDICTVVMPEAEHKFFITASPRVRAKRRLLEMQQKGEDAPSLDALEKSILERDYTDSHRAVNPLKKTDDAMLIDTTDMTIQESIQTVVDAINKK
ncbi:(d)CMP kinase [Christensenellaceae bacterium OttesenSCG-928-M15]|nr:(d)CMP kinase [Christensenellaceae bacterium OttesenSCG-928-M15]